MDQFLQQIELLLRGVYELDAVAIAVAALAAHHFTEALERVTSETLSVNMVEMVYPALRPVAREVGRWPVLQAPQGPAMKGRFGAFCKAIELGKNLPLPVKAESRARIEPHSLRDLIDVCLTNLLVTHKALGEGRSMPIRKDREWDRDQLERIVKSAQPLPPLSPQSLRIYAKLIVEYIGLQGPLEHIDAIKRKYGSKLKDMQDYRLKDDVTKYAVSVLRDRIKASSKRLDN